MQSAINDALQSVSERDLTLNEKDYFTQLSTDLYIKNIKPVISQLKSQGLFSTKGAQLKNSMTSFKLLIDNLFSLYKEIQVAGRKIKESMVGIFYGPALEESKKWADIQVILANEGTCTKIKRLALKLS